ncbi:MAG: hypothetical protein IKU02_08680 [Bacteroidaceae bacterium]|nr:hypothetical protein [Bacteroidaceae bacterium]
MWIIGFIILVVAMFFFKAGGSSFNSGSGGSRTQWRQKEEDWAQLDEDLE